MTKNEIIKRALQVNGMLRRLETKAQALAEEIANSGEPWEDMGQLFQTLQDLAGFDLEDSIPQTAPRCKK